MCLRGEHPAGALGPAASPLLRVRRFARAGRAPPAARRRIRPREERGLSQPTFSGTAAAVVIGFSSELTLRLGRGIAALGGAASPVLRCPRPATAGVRRPGGPSARPPATLVVKGG